MTPTTTPQHFSPGTVTATWTVGEQASNDQGKWLREGLTTNTWPFLGPSRADSASIQALTELPLTRSIQSCSWSKRPAWHKSPCEQGILQSVHYSLTRASPPFHGRLPKVKDQLRYYVAISMSVARTPQCTRAFNLTPRGKKIKFRLKLLFSIELRFNPNTK